MRFTRIEKDEDLAKLARRVYPKASAEVLRTAERVLREANPHLEAPEQASPGTIVVVPDLAGTDVRAEASDESDIIQGLLRQARQQLGDIGAALNTRLDRQAEEAKSNIALAKSTALRKHIEKFPELRSQLNQITLQEGNRIKTVETLRQLNQEGVTQLNRDLDEFLGEPRPPQPLSDRPIGRQKPPRKKA